MSRFVLLDHSLDALGGHHYETALHVLRAAQQIGFEILLATNQRFTARSELPAEWQVVSPFPDNAYVPEARIVPSPVAPAEPPTTGRFRSGIPGWLAQWPGWLTHWRRARRTARRRLAHQQRFARACQQVFAGVELERGDHVFLPTVNELDLAGLTWFLSQSPRLNNADWHLQFHFDFAPDNRPGAETFERMQLEFRAALSRAAGFRLHFYTTTRQLSERYRRLRVAPFHTLPYSLNPAFLQPNERADVRASSGATEHADERRNERPTAGQPLRVLLAGGVRPEKGQQNLATVIEQLWDDYLAQGRLQLQVQGQPEDLERLLPGHLAGGKLPRQSSPPSTASCVLVPHPLPADDYVRLIRDADLGLLLYDARKYRHRRAGVLCELLCSGVPVIVPAGCWLADELTEWIQSHRQEVVERMPTLAEWRGSRLDSSTSSGAPRRGAEHYVGGAGAGLVVQVPAPPRAAQLALSFRLPSDEPGEHYVRVDVEQFDERRRRLASAGEILGSRAGAAPLRMLASLVPGAARVRLQVHSADERQCLRVTDMSLRFGGTGGAADDVFPLGAVGLVAAEVGEVGRLVSDIVRHYPHYRRTAQRFARANSPGHEPATTLRSLLAHGAPAFPQPAALQVETDLATTRKIPDISPPAASRSGQWAPPVAPRTAS